MTISRLAQVDSQSPAEHIARIRHEKYALGSNGSLFSRNSLVDDLQNSVNHLSEGLYSENIHFVLELIQNAEDNSYSKGCSPKLSFHVLNEDPSNTPGADGALLVINNELGLRPKDVDALCAIGKSTKTKRQGYIGEKGIGFKSVFKVTRRPHLFSAGYQFYFDREPHPELGLGYIVPYWLDSVPSDLLLEVGATHILLPLDSEKRTHVVEQIARIAPETILFLTKLESLTIEQPQATALKLEVDKRSRPLVIVKNGDRSVPYWIHQRSVLRPADLVEEKRPGVSSRDVSIAFRLQNDPMSVYSVFAYLPTEMKSGFPFLVNADFILSTSREVIPIDRPWNQWLRDQIAPCFVEAFVKLIRDRKYCQQAYRYIPLKDDVGSPFFAKTVEAIHTDLRNRAVVRTDPGNALVVPSDARLAPSGFWKLVEKKRYPQQLKRTPLVLQKLESYSRQLRAIGVTTLQPEEVRACLQDEAWLGNRTPEWFVKLFGYLQQDKWRVPASYEREAKSLEGLTIIPTSDGRLAAVGKEAVYLPEPAAEALAREQADLLGGLQSVAFLSTELFHLLTNRPELLDWVKREIARPWTPEAYCRDLVKALGAGVARLSVADLVKATKIVRDLTERAKGTSTRELCDGLPVRLENGDLIVIQRSTNTDVITPDNLEPDIGWQEAFPSQSDRAGLRILSSSYLEGCTETKERERWTTFFDAVGLTKTPIPTRTWTWWYGLPADMPRSLQDQVQKQRHYYSTQGYKLSDIRLPQWLVELAPSGRSDAANRHRSKALLRWLERALGLGLQRPAWYSYHYRRWFDIGIESDSRRILQTAAWFPSTQGFRRPGEVFLNRKEAHEIFGDTVPYAAETIDPRLAEWLGVRQSATVSEVLGYLGQLAERPAEEVSATLVQRIYTFLMERWRADDSSGSREDRGQFAQRPMIRVEHPTAKWVLRDDAIWANRSDVFGDDFAYLELNYPARLHDFFVDQLSVKADADDELYARAWLKQQEEEDPDPKKVEALLERVFPVMRTRAANPILWTWWSDFQDHAMIWTQQDRFQEPSEVFIPDDGVLKKIMEPAGVPFAWRPSKDSFADHSVLYGALGVRSLIASTTCELGAEVETDEVPGGEELFLTRAAKRSICFYLWNQARDEYTRLRDDGSLAALLAARETRVQPLVLVYTLDDFEVEDRKAVAHFASEAQTLYLSEAATVEALDVEVPALLARFLSRGRANRGLNDFIASILGKSEKHLDYLIQKNDWHLPLEEREWMERAIAGEAAPAAVIDEETPASVGEAEPVAEEEGADDGAKQGGRQAPADRGVETESGAPAIAAPEPLETGPVAGTPPGGGGPAPAEAHATRREGAARIEAEATHPGVTRTPSGQHGDGGAGRATGHYQSSTDRDAEPDEDRAPQERRSAYPESESMAKRHGHGMDPEKRNQLENAGIAAVEAYEWAHGRKPVVLPDGHPGWDINSFEQPILPDAPPDRRIEVKAKEGFWDDWGVALTPTEYESARKHGETYFLYVVEHALDGERRRIYIFRNPVAKTTEYRFRRDWRDDADEQE